eukprot:TRINITY_DN32309_c0_g1_i1.p1 TRINITY_DN32309_c0_g1~~TRINITY_DN32309_c0_g1_i1.p1  ORF type:complete len:281 (+),score=14.36 TRINITY_DN32309_c0_g1_i1:206-1048(+)
MKYITNLEVDPHEYRQTDKLAQKLKKNTPTTHKLNSNAFQLCQLLNPKKKKSHTLLINILFQSHNETKRRSNKDDPFVRNNGQGIQQKVKKKKKQAPPQMQQSKNIGFTGGSGRGGRVRNKLGEGLRVGVDFCARMTMHPQPWLTKQTNCSVKRNCRNTNGKQYFDSSKKFNLMVFAMNYYSKFVIKIEKTYLNMFFLANYQRTQKRLLTLIKQPQKLSQFNKPTKLLSQGFMPRKIQDLNDKNIDPNTNNFRFVEILENNHLRTTKKFRSLPPLPFRRA